MYKKILILCYSVVFVFFIGIDFVVAYDCPCAPGKTVTVGVYTECTAACRDLLSKEGASITNPLGDIDTPQKLIGKIINSALGIVGSIALVMFIYGGFTWMLAAGNAEAVSKGKNILIWSVIGLVIIFSSYALVNFVFDSIGA
jgi:hypothetical protein